VAKWIAILAALVAIVFFPKQGRADEWRTEDTVREVLCQTLILIDEQQTENIARNPDKYREVGIAKQFIGEHPSVDQVRVYFLASAIVHAGVSYMLPHGWRDAYQYVMFAYRYDAVSKNVQVMGGLKVPF
jgi:hypothetical protein